MALRSSGDPAAEAASASDAAAYNALGMLYHKVPGWPISFGSNKKARDYFEKAIAL